MQRNSKVSIIKENELEKFLNNLQSKCPLCDDTDQSNMRDTVKHHFQRHHVNFAVKVKFNMEESKCFFLNLHYFKHWHRIFEICTDGWKNNQTVQHIIARTCRLHPTTIILFMRCCPHIAVHYWLAQGWANVFNRRAIWRKHKYQRASKLFQYKNGK